MGECSHSFWRENGAVKDIQEFRSLDGDSELYADSNKNYIILLLMNHILILLQEIKLNHFNDKFKFSNCRKWKIYCCSSI